jgi:hypothetical protein
MPPTLDDALRSVKFAVQLPWTLPASHLADARDFGAIVSAGALSPRRCEVFEENLVYLFYGGVFYRRSCMPTKAATSFPVAFLFNPIVLGSVERFYPFDTGGMERGLFGPWRKRFEPCRERCRVSGGDFKTPARVVYCYFRTNEDYLFGKPHPDCCTYPDPLPDLYEFFSDDLSVYGADERCRMIEGHSTVPLSLKDVIWVGFPEGYDQDFLALCEQLQPVVPQYFRYRSFPFPRPIELAAVLKDRAHREVVERYVGFK